MEHRASLFVFGRNHRKDELSTSHEIGNTTYKCSSNVDDGKQRRNKTDGTQDDRRTTKATVLTLMQNSMTSMKIMRKWWKIPSTKPRRPTANYVTRRKSLWSLMIVQWWRKEAVK